ncbi:sensitivity to high expression protein she9 [Malassezia vespertilionis]|uniref:Sensitive to high expression protein 9, mitochondrial n=1 Tax=Malassezia vespertilionis TaxID=2020962 RepID=A0A2N1JEQ1_9BASI|nr:sensitivity to high expression protein she9 [Malassezia vespertilionis]PKI85020.1 She9p [Malassezia vespertilionis]WFD05975.1 sensitivity to high expression protein she9 [Malassezia vespertilionis]
MYTNAANHNNGVRNSWAKAQGSLHNWFERRKPAAMGYIDNVSRRWNQYTGYDEIIVLKDQVQLETTRLKTLQEQKNEAKDVYVRAVAQRSIAQRKINDLLSRKPTWNDTDLSEYTKLLHSEHSDAKAEEQSEQQYNTAETEMERGFDDLMRSVMRRYHEEHLWSDRIRSVSTYVSIGLGLLNVLIFIVALLFVEPYKRKKLAKTLEKRLVAGEETMHKEMHDALSDIDAHLGHLKDVLEGTPRRSKGTRALGETLPPPHKHNFPSISLGTWGTELMALFYTLRSYTTHFVQQIGLFSRSEQVNMTATATGLVVGGLFSWWIAVLLL